MPRIGNALTATDNDESETNNAENEVPKTSHGARYTMDPRVREDDEVRELIGTIQLSFPCIWESIHPQAPDATFGNTFTITDKN